MTADVVLRTRAGDLVGASVRTSDGIFDLDLRADRLRCSCGRLSCAHARALRSALSSVVEEQK